VRQHFGLDTDPDAEASAPADQEPRYVVSDFYGAYHQLERHGWPLVGCWAHARRPLVRVGRTHPDWAPWADAWRARIAHLYQYYRIWRATGRETAARRQAQADLEAHLTAMRDVWTRELVDMALPEVAREALRLMARHWDRLTQFLQDPQLPRDNNAAERCLRTPVIGRKKFAGSRARWAGQLAAQVWTFTETARQHGLDPLVELTRYLDACAAAGGAPPPRDARTAFHFWEFSAPAQEDTS
jgi:transposase